MTRYGMPPRQRDIVLIPIPFSDLTSIKQRPVLVLSNDRHNQQSEDVLVAAMTSKLSRVPYSDRVKATDLSEGMLRKESQIRIDKIYTLSKTIIVKRFGRINQSIFHQVLTQLDLLLGR